LFENARVIPPERAYADHGYMDQAVVAQKEVSAASCRRASILLSRPVKRYDRVPTDSAPNVYCGVAVRSCGCLREFACFSLNSDGTSLRQV